MRLSLILTLFAASLAPAQTKDPNKSGFPHDMLWFNPPKNPQPGVVHHGYKSGSMNTQVGYNIYLPLGYESGSRRYPVVYWLHGRGGTESSNGYPLRYLTEAMAAGKLPPMIVVFPNGGSQSNYCDSFDGKYMGETTVIKELIPYIDANYRTIAARAGRSIQGMSMGGFGAMRLGVNYADLFSSIVAFAGGYRWPEEIDKAHFSWKEMFNNDPEIVKGNIPETWARRNLDKIRGEMAIQIYVGDQDPGLAGNRRMHAVLDELKIPHGYQEFPGIAHNLGKLAEQVKAENFAIAARAFGEAPAKSSAERRVETTLQPDAKLAYAKGTQRDLFLHVFRPPQWSAGDKRPAIVFFFGGGWVGGTPTQFYGHSSRLASLGMVAISAEYRTNKTDGTDPFASMADAKAAIRWVRAHAVELGIDPNRIAAGGGSAGGHVALSSAVLAVERPEQDLSIRSTPDLLVLYNPVVDTTERGYGHERLGARMLDASPVDHLRAGLPAAIVFHGTADTTVPFENVERLCKGMQALGEECELVPYAGMKHGFFNATNEANYRDTLRRTIDFLRRHEYLPRENQVR
jgi:acetyl esterase